MHTSLGGDGTHKKKRGGRDQGGWRHTFKKLVKGSVIKTDEIYGGGKIRKYPLQKSGIGAVKMRTMGSCRKMGITNLTLKECD